MFFKVKRFCESEDGAVTVDWVVLTAAILAMGTAVMTALNPAGMVAPIATEMGEGVPDTGF